MFLQRDFSRSSAAKLLLDRCLQAAVKVLHSIGSSSLRPCRRPRNKRSDDQRDWIHSRAPVQRVRSVGPLAWIAELCSCPAARLSLFNAKSSQRSRQSVPWAEIPELYVDAPVLKTIHVVVVVSRALRVAARAASPPLDTITTTSNATGTRAPGGKWSPPPPPQRPHLYLPGTTGGGPHGPQPMTDVLAAQRQYPGSVRTVPHDDLAISGSQVRILPGAPRSAR